MRSLNKIDIGVSPADIRAINRTFVLEFIRCNGPTSSNDISSSLRLTQTEVEQLIHDLTDDKWLKFSKSKTIKSDMKSIAVEFNGEGHLAICIDLGGTKIHGAVADLNGKILHEMHFEHGQSSPESSFRVLSEAIFHLIEQANKSYIPLTGISIGVPGIAQRSSGMVTNAPGLGWENFPLKQRLSEIIPFPIEIENDVNLAALGEYWSGTEPGDENIVLMAIGTGIGAGIVIDGMIYHGAHDMAGEVGYLLPAPSNLNQRHPGFGAFEQLASGTGIAERANRLLNGLNEANHQKVVTTEQVFTAAREHKAWARQVVDETVDILAQGIASICLIVDPHVIIISGGVARSADLLIEPISARLQGVIPVIPRITSSRLGNYAPVMGGIALVLRSAAHYRSIPGY